MKWLKFFLLALCPFILASKVSAETDPAGSGEMISPDFYGTNGIKNKLIKPKCLGCHSSQLSGTERNGAPEGSNFDTLQDAKDHADAIIQRAVVQMDMPPNPAQQLTEAEKLALKNWVAFGYPGTGLSSHYSAGNVTLPKVFVYDADGNALGTAEAEMSIIKSTPPFQFEITNLKYTPLEQQSQE